MTTIIEIADQIKTFVEGSDDWEKMETPIPTVYITKIPNKTGGSSKIAIKLTGKRKEVYITTLGQLAELKKAVSNPNTAKLIKAVAKANGKSTPVKPAMKKIDF